jgi:hypothetical protein
MELMACGQILLEWTARTLPRGGVRRMGVTQPIQVLVRSKDYTCNVTSPHKPSGRRGYNSCNLPGNDTHYRPQHCSAWQDLLGADAVLLGLSALRGSCN